MIERDILDWDKELTSFESAVCDNQAVLFEECQLALLRCASRNYGVKTSINFFVENKLLFHYNVNNKFTYKY